MLAQINRRSSQIKVSWLSISIKVRGTSQKSQLHLQILYDRCFIVPLHSGSRRRRSTTVKTAYGLKRVGARRAPFGAARGPPRCCCCEEIFLRKPYLRTRLWFTLAAVVSRSGLYQPSTPAVSRGLSLDYRVVFVATNATGAPVTCQV